MTTVAGNGVADFGGDGGAALSASLNGPEGVAIDAAGNVYIADTFNHRVRLVTPDGIISTFAGNGFPGFAGDDGKPSSASMFLPTDVALDASGNLYIADLGNSRIRKVTNGVITTIAGNSGGLAAARRSERDRRPVERPHGCRGGRQRGRLHHRGFDRLRVGARRRRFPRLEGRGRQDRHRRRNRLEELSGDGASAALAQFDTPAGMARDSRGNLYIADSRNNRIRKIAPRWHGDHRCRQRAARLRGG